MDKIVLSDQKNLQSLKINEWEQGLRPDGSKIGVYKDAEYAIFKDHINPRAGGYVDLLLSRNTAKSLFVIKAQQGYIFNMNDQHGLVRKYGIDILGLNQESFNKRQEDVYQYALLYSLRKIINGA